jgi:hypothetical protein
MITTSPYHFAIQYPKFKGQPVSGQCATRYTEEELKGVTLEPNKSSPPWQNFNAYTMEVDTIEHVQNHEGRTEDLVHFKRYDGRVAQGFPLQEFNIK